LQEQQASQSEVKPPIPPWMDRRIVFVSGKGGVGKSLVSAAIASANARAGKKVLLVEIGETSYYKDFWRLGSVGHEPLRVKYGFDLALWSAETCLHEYVLFYLRMERVYKLFFENKVMRALINVAPGLSEIAILGKITSGLRKVGPPMHYDVIVVDCYATGHALALLNAPKGMMEAIRIGPMGTQSREMEKVISDPKLTAYVAATLLEEMPVTETLEFSQSLLNLVGQRPEIIANKTIEMPVSKNELGLLREVPGVDEFVRYLTAVSGRQAEYAAQLCVNQKTLPTIPLIFSPEADVLVGAATDALLAPPLTLQGEH
jgi:anion-transporting  ArsA/GET3 family ATPase